MAASASPGAPPASQTRQFTLDPTGALPHVDRLAAYLGIDADILTEGLMLAAARDAAVFGEASAAARRVRASSQPEPAEAPRARGYMTLG